MAKGLSPSVEEKSTIIYQSILETRENLAFLKRDCLRVFFNSYIVYYRIFFFLSMLTSKCK